jgi:hypothetical protein
MFGRLSAWNNLAPTGRIFMKLDIRGLFEDLSRNFKFRLNLNKIASTLRRDLCRFHPLYRPRRPVGRVEL